MHTVIEGSASTTVQPVQDTFTDGVEWDALGSPADDMEPENMINGVCSAVLVAISLAFCPTTNGQYFLGCPPVDDVHDAATILPNPYNCSTFYICAQGTPLLFRCPGHLQFNYELEVCDYPERANCFELQQYPEPVTTYLPAADFEATHVHAEKNSEPEDKAAPQPTQAQVQLTPEPHTEQPQKAVEFQSHSTAVSSEWSGYASTNAFL
ncbi:hypothetical protein MTO96_033885 [Rhipicephalus appendiculatus]